MDSELLMILLTLCGYSLSAAVLILTYAFFKYVRNKKTEENCDTVIDESCDKQSLNIELLERSQSQFDQPATSIKNLGLDKGEDCGRPVDKLAVDPFQPVLKETSSRKNNLKRYNPFEWLNIDFIFDESGLQEAYKDVKEENYKKAKEDKEFHKYKGFLAWLRGMIIIDEDVIK